MATRASEHSAGSWRLSRFHAANHDDQSAGSPTTPSISCDGAVPTAPPPPVLPPHWDTVIRSRGRQKTNASCPAPHGSCMCGNPLLADPSCRSVADYYSSGSRSFARFHTKNLLLRLASLLRTSSKRTVVSPKFSGGSPASLRASLSRPLPAC